MLNRIIAFSLQNRVFVAAAALVVAAYGTWIALRRPIDVLPDLNRPTVVVMAEAHAMVPEDVERRVTWPLEQVLTGATGVTRVRSGSAMGLAMLFVEFGWGTDVYRNRQIVQEKLQLTRDKLPPGVEPRMAPISSIMGNVQLIGVRSRSGAVHPDELRALADYQIKYRLLSIPGVAKVVAAGGAPRQLQAIVDVEKLRAHDVTLDEVAAAVKRANVNVSGGFLNLGHKAPAITVKGYLTCEAELADAVVKPGGARPVRVRDVARVAFGPASIRTGEAGINGDPGIVIAVYKQLDVDTVDLTRRITTEIESIRRGLPEDIVILDRLFQQSAFIHRAVDNVLAAVRDGCLLVVLVLFAFLLNFRTTVITLTAIPLSLAITALIFAAANLSINTMTLGGIAVAIGALVDDAIVDVENVFRRLRENAARGRPRHALAVIFRASSEVRRPILIGTFLVIVVTLPLFFLTGLEGRLFTPIGIAYITSVLASLGVAHRDARALLVLADRPPVDRAAGIVAGAVVETGGGPADRTQPGAARRGAGCVPGPGARRGFRVLGAGHAVPASVQRGGGPGKPLAPAGDRTRDVGRVRTPAGAGAGRGRGRAVRGKAHRSSRGRRARARRQLQPRCGDV